MIFLQCLEMVGNVPDQIDYLVLLTFVLAYEIHMVDYVDKYTQRFHLKKRLFYDGL